MRDETPHRCALHLQPLATAVAAARAQLDAARKEYQRSERLFRKQYISQAAMDQAEAQFKASRAQARAMLARFDSPRAWRMVAAAFVAMFAAYGIAYSFGAFFKPMAAEFGADRSRTSVIFSLTVCVWSMLGSLSGHLSDRFGPRVVVAIGAIVMGAGLVMTAFIDRLWMGYLTYSLAVGIGVAAAYVPTVAVVGGCR